MGDYLWSFTVDSASELPAKPGKDRSVHVEAQLITMGGKIEQTVTTPVAIGCDPVWSYRVFQYPYQNIQNKYSNIKFLIYDGKELLGQARINWEFIGEPPKDKFYTLRITGKKKDVQVGKIKVHTVYQKFGVSTSASVQVRTAPAVRPTPLLKSASGPVSQTVHTPPISGSQRTAEAIRKLKEQGGVIEVKDFKSEDAKAYVRNSRVQFSAAGRRFIQIPTSGIEKFITFNELPPFEIVAGECDKTSKDELLKIGFNLNNALWLTTCAQLAYKDEEVIYDVCKNVWDMKGCIFVESRATDTQGFCMHNEEILVICFRGTESLKDWKTNLNFVLIPGNYPDRYQQAGVKVHQGFFTAIMAVWDQVSEFVDQAYSLYPHLKLIICGHSLGGALANLCCSFYTLTDNPKPVHAVYTIGQPRVGNRKFKQTLEQSSPNTRYMRITNNQDIVPNLAAGQHCGTHVHITANGRFSFKPPAWKKAVNEVQSLQNSAAGMQYAGLADHSSNVYRKLIEQNWTRYLVLKNNASSYNLYELAEQSLIIIDMVTEAVKGVRSYKPQFRAAVAQIILLKPLLDSASDYAVFMTAAQQYDIQQNVQGINSVLAKIQKEINDNQKEKSVIQRGAAKERNFNKTMKQLCHQMQNSCDAIHDTLTATNSVYDDQVGTNSPGFSITRYDVSSYKIQFYLINFDEISNKALQTRRTKNKSEEIGLMIDTAEEMMMEGDLSVCLQFLQKIPIQPDYQRCATDEQKANYSYLLAKCHAMLHHDNEAMNALKELSKCSSVTDDLIQDQAFTNICTTAQFQAIANSVQQTAKQKHIYEEKLKPDEIEILSGMFDTADEAGDGYLTLPQFQQLIEGIGIETILDSVGWKSGKSVVLQVYSILQKIENECQGQVNLQQFLDLMSSLLPAECAKTSTKSKTRRSHPNTAGPVWNLFTPPN